MMDPIELQILITQGKLPKDVSELVFEMDDVGDGTLRDLRDRVLGGDSEEPESTTPESTPEPESNPEDNTTEVIETDGDTTEVIEEHTPSLINMNVDDLLVLDREIVTGCDDEAVEFFIEYKLRKFWNQIINGERSVDS